MPLSIRSRSLTLCCLLACIQAPSPAESLEEFPPVIIEPLEFPPSLQTPNGTFILSDTDFIYCDGKNFQGGPPVVPPFLNGKSAGILNNEILEALFHKEGSTDALREAIRLFQSAEEMDPLFFPFVYNLAHLMALSGRRVEALHLFARSVEIIPNFSGSYRNLGQLYLRLGKETEGVASLKMAAKSNPRMIEPLLDLARHSIEGGLISRAKYYLDEAEAIRPNHPGIVEARAEMMERSGQKESARTLYNSIVFESDIGEEIRYEPSIHHRRATYYERLGEYEAALRDYRKLLEFKRTLFLYGIDPAAVVRRIIAIEKKTAPPSDGWEPVS